MADDAGLVGIPPVPPSRARKNNRVVQLLAWKAEA